jgi:WXG100 family type VII secretion target
MSTIRMSYPEMCAAAGDISRCAERTRASLVRLHQAATQLDPHWTGRARGAFDRDMAACVLEASHFPRMLEQISAALTKTAEIVRLAEQRARDEIAATVAADAAGGAA